MPAKITRYQTQWTAQFFVAAELTRRGYLVTLTFGNAPASDLLVCSPNAKAFTIDVKGQSTRTFWLLQQRAPSPDHYFVLVYLPPNLGQPQFFVVASDALMARRDEYRQRIKRRGRYRDELGGINWTTAFEYENNWASLPE